MLSRFCSLLIGLSLLAASVAQAAPPGLIVTSDGYYAVTVGPDGKPVQEKITQVMDLRGGGGTPTPGPTPPPAADPIAAQVKGWASEVGDPTSAQALAIVYREVAKSAAGQPREKVLQALRQASDSVLGSTGGTEKWKNWRGKVSALLDAQEATGTVDYAKFCNSVAVGLESSTTGAALDPALLTLIVQLVLQIIQLIFGGGGGGGV